MKRYIAMILVLALLLCGCGTQNNTVETQAPQTEAPVQTTQPAETEATEDTSHNVELTVWVIGDLWMDQETLDAMLNEFYAYYPNILIRVSHKTPEDVEQTKPDIVLGNAKDLARWAAEGNVADVSVFLEESTDYYSAATAACSSEEGFFALPLCVVPYCMGIRRDLFEAAEAMTLINPTAHTWTSSNFSTVLSNLEDLGVENALSVYCQDTDGDSLFRLLVENLAGIKFVNTINGTYQMDSKNFKTALNILKNVDNVPFREDQNAEAALEEFLNGESAMTVNWSSALQLQYGEEYDIMYMLYPGGNKATTYAEVYGLSVFDNGDETRLTASLTFLSYLAASDGAVRATGHLAARKSAARAYADTELESVMADLNRLLGFVTEGEIPGQKWEEARELWMTMLQELANDRAVSGCVDRCNRGLERLLDEE